MEGDDLPLLRDEQPAAALQSSDHPGAIAAMRSGSPSSAACTCWLPKRRMSSTQNPKKTAVATTQERMSPMT